MDKTQEERIKYLEAKVKKLEVISYVHLAIVIFGVAGITAFISVGLKKLVK